MSIISKSQFVRSCKCLKSLYLYRNNPELRDEVESSQQAIFNQGHQVGELAQQLFPNGVDATCDPYYDYKKSVKITKELIEKKHAAIYEAGFLYKNVYAALTSLR